MFAGLRWSTPSGPRSCASCSPCSLEIEYGQSRWVHVTPVFGRSQTSPGFVCGFLQEDAEIRECEPTPRLVSMVGQHRNQTSVARETARILHPDIRFATEDRGSPPARAPSVGSAMRRPECPRDCWDEWQGRTSRALLPAPCRSRPRYLRRPGFRQRIFLVSVMRRLGPRRGVAEQADG
jgi:hypothetical protein